MHLLANSVSLPYSVTPSAHHVANCACLTVPNCTFFYWRVRSCFVVFGFFSPPLFCLFLYTFADTLFCQLSFSCILGTMTVFFLTSVGLYISCLVVVTSVWSFSVFVLLSCLFMTTTRETLNFDSYSQRVIEHVTSSIMP